MGQGLRKGHWPVQCRQDELGTVLKQAEQDFKGLMSKETLESAGDKIFKELNNKGKEMGNG